MPYCKKCGKELSSSESFCSSCGTKVDSISFSEALSQVKREAAGFSKKVAENVKSSDYGGKIKTSISLLGTEKPLFFATIIMFVLNFFLSFADMLDITIIFSSRSASFLGLFKLLREYAGGGGDAEYFIPILTVCSILIAFSALLTALPLLFGKKYNRCFLILNYISSIFVTAVYILLCAAYSDSSEVSVKFMGYFYILQTMACFVVTFIFSRKLKERNNKKAEAGNSSPLPETIQEKENIE